MERRTFIQVGTGLAAITALQATAGATAAVEPTSGGEQYASILNPKPLPFNPASVPGLSERLLTSHHDNNYGGAVRRLNTINRQLANLDFPSAPGFNINGLKREQLMAANAVILHEIYFSGLGGNGEPGGTLALALERDFGSVDKWRAEFTAMGKALGGGSGWVLLAYSPRLQRMNNFWANDHTMTVADGIPLLALDMYEHSYHMDYGSNAGAYVHASMKVIKWDYAQLALDQVSR